MQSVEGTAFVRFVAPAASASVTASSRTAIKDAARLRTRHADATAHWPGERPSFFVRSPG